MRPEAPGSRRGRSRDRPLQAGLAGLAVVILVGALAPWIAPYDPLEQLDAVGGRHRPPLTVMAAVRLRDKGWQLADRVERVPGGLLIERDGKRRVEPAEQVLNLTGDGVADRRVFVLGSDRFGRDVLSRIVYGARISLLIGFLAVAIALVIGCTVGALAALGPRLVDAFLMRVVDGMLAFPWILVLIVLVAFFAAGTRTLTVMMGCLAWMGIARLMRAELMSLKQRDFVVAARGLGASPWRVFFRHLLPNAFAPVLLQAVLIVGGLILAESTLSFLGFGVQPPEPSWGNMIAEGRHHLSRAWWAGLFPGLALVGTVIALNVAADGLRDLLDPRRVSARPVVEPR